MKLKGWLTGLALSLLALPGLAQASTWTGDPEKFKAGHVDEHTVTSTTGAPDTHYVRIEWVDADSDGTLDAGDGLYIKQGSTTYGPFLYSGGAILPLSQGGTGSALATPTGDIIWGFDATDAAWHAFTIGTGLSYDHSTHTLSASGAGTVGGTGTDNHLMRWNGTADGQDSGWILDDGDGMTATGAAVALTLEDTTSSAVVITGHASGSGFNTTGVFGLVDSTTDFSVGVEGRSSGGSGKGRGVMGTEDSSNRAAYSIFANEETYLGNFADIEEQSGAPATAQSGRGTVWEKNDNTLHFQDDGGTDKQVATLTGTETLANKTLTGEVLTAGTTALAPLAFNSGTNLTSPVAGALEYDGVNFYATPDTTGGRGAVDCEQQFHLTADGSNITTIANFFGTTSNIPLVASAYYEVDIALFYRNATAGTATITLTNSSAPTSQCVTCEMCPLTGVVTPPGTATMLAGQSVKDSTAALAYTTGTLSNLVSFYTHIHMFIQNGTGTSLKIQMTKTSGGGAITPLLGSCWKCRRISPNNIGTFAS